MVCKRSLYCWKNGPCASDEARKQIWEDNIRFRQSLRDINQSDHYWSFQISKNLCLCLEGEQLFPSFKGSLRYHTGSLQRLDDIDCTSITHDCNGLKFRNCLVHCPINNLKKDVRGCEKPIPQTLLPISNVGGMNTKERLRPFRPLHKTNENKPEYCHRYKNTLTNSNLKSGANIRFSSQLNLAEKQSAGEVLEKKQVHGSCHNLSTPPKAILSAATKEESHSVTNGLDKSVNTSEALVKKDHQEVKAQQAELNPVVVRPSRELLRGCTPVSRTTRKMLHDTKQIPFVTFGCNNKNRDIGSKRTYNVLASKMEVYPSALSAKQHKRNLILKYIQSEKEFQKKCLPQDFNKGIINHSSLWSIDREGKENKLVQKKNGKNHLPLVNKPQKMVSGHSAKGEPFPYKTYRKPQIYFY